MSESNTRIVELEAERDELRLQLAGEKAQHAITKACFDEAVQRAERSAVAIAEVEARTLEHAALEFKAKEAVWVRATLLRLAMVKRAGSQS